MSFEPVELAAGDGPVLRGECWVDGADWLVLFHDLGGDLDAWRPLIGLAAVRGWSVLALDLRGHGGSDDPWDAEKCPADVALAIAEARRRGASTVCVGGAGVSAIAALRAASDTELDALVLLSPGPVPDGPRDTLRGPGISKLVVYGSHAPADDAEAKSSPTSRSAPRCGWDSRPRRTGPTCSSASSAGRRSSTSPPSGTSSATSHRRLRSPLVSHPLDSRP